MTVTYHTKLVNGEYTDCAEPSIVVYVHAAECPIEGCSCEPTVKEAEILI
jgi:hypothetical protein